MRVVFGRWLATLGCVLLLSACGPESSPKGAESSESEEDATSAAVSKPAQERPTSEDLEAVLKRGYSEIETEDPDRENLPGPEAQGTSEVADSAVPQSAPPLPSFLAGEGGSIRVRMEPSLNQIGREWEEGPEGRRNFTMPLPDGTEATVVVDRFVAVGEDGGEFTGRLEGHPDSRVNLSYRRGAEVGTIRIPSENRLVRILPASGGELVITETEIPEDGAPGLPPGLKIPEDPPPNFIPEPPAELGSSADRFDDESEGPAPTMDEMPVAPPDSIPAIEP